MDTHTKVGETGTAEVTDTQKITNVRQYIDDEFRGLFRDVYNIIEIAFSENKEIGEKVKELTGKRISILNENIMKSVDSLYPMKFQQTLPPVSARVR